MPITWVGYKGTADNGDTWAIKIRPSGGFNVLHNGTFIGSAFNMTDAKNIADQIDAE